MDHLETIWGPVLEVDSGVDSGSIMRYSGPVLGPFLGNLMKSVNSPSFGRG